MKKENRGPENAQAVALVEQVRDHYQRLTSFSMRIEHMNSSGLYPGRFTQTLRWQRGGRFELRQAAGGTQDVPDFVADGFAILSIMPGGKRRTESLVPAPNTLPGWEVSGGIILGWLQSTPSSNVPIATSEDVAVAWEIGGRKEWMGQRVREVVRTVSKPARGQTFNASLFVDAVRDELVGFESSGQGTIGYAHYAEQKEDAMADDLVEEGPQIA